MLTGRVEISFAKITPKKKKTRNTAMSAKPPVLVGFYISKKDQRAAAPVRAFVTNLM